MNDLRIFSLALLLMLTPLVQSNEPTSPNVDTVELFMAAFNLQDSNAMAELVSEDIEWLSIDGQKVTVEVRGKSALIESMDGYFTSCPTCRSELSGVVSTSTRVSAVEIASWQGKNGRNSQRAIAVYEFSGVLIHRVYYFSAEK